MLPLFIAGCVLGMLGGKIPEAEFALFFPIPGFYLYVVARVFRFVRYPREDTWAFVLLLTYPKRKQLAVHFLNGMSKDCILLTITALVLFASARFSSGVQAPSVSSALSTMLFIALQIPIFHFVLRGGIAVGFFGPVRHDSRPFFVFTVGSASFWEKVASARIAVATALGSWTSNPVRFHLTRILLYIIRQDLFGFLLSYVFALTLSVLFSILLGKNNGAAIGLCFCAGILFVCTRLTELLRTAHTTLLTCEYYRATGEGLNKAYSILASILIVPLCVLYPLVYLWLTHGSVWYALVTIITFFVAAATCLLYTVSSWKLLASDGITVGNFGTLILCLLIGLSIPWYGGAFILFSAVAIRFTMQRSLRLPKK